MMRKRTVPLLIALLLSAISLFGVSQASAQNLPEDTLNVAFFHSPTCPHCHYVRDNVLPDLIAQYGDQLNIIEIDVTQSAGQDLYQKTISALNIDPSRRGVPTLVVGDEVMVGQVEVENQLPGLLEAGVANGGIPLADVEGLTAVIGDGAATSGAGLTALVLVGMVSSLGFGGWRLAQIRPKLTQIQFKPDQGNLIIGLALVGIVIAGYLTLTNVTANEVACGAVGDCNVVQNSAFSTLLGIPVSWLGLLTYILVLALWLLQERLAENLRPYARAALMALSTIAVLFSLYLMFVTLAFIQTTCLWCIGSAITATALFLVLCFQLIDPIIKPKRRKRRAR